VGTEKDEETDYLARNGTVSPVLESFSEERGRIDRINARLDVADDPSERADLGSELVRSISRYEDTFERTILPRLEGSDQELLDQLERDREELRETMDDIHQRTKGIDPRNVHASDGEGFEVSLTAVVGHIRALLVLEDDKIESLLRTLGDDEQRLLADEVSHAFQNASERPRPPRTALGRFISNTSVKLDHTLEDVATPHHPGADTISG
jgi:hypothetical protein